MSLLLALTAGGVVTTSIADPGTFLVSGSATVETIQSQAGAGAFAFAGASATDTLQSAAGAGSYLVTGTASTDTLQSAAGTGAFAYSGSATTDTIQAGDIISVADPGAFAYSGVDTADVVQRSQQNHSGWFRLMIEAIQAKEIEQRNQQSEKVKEAVKLPELKAKKKPIVLPVDPISKEDMPVVSAPVVPFRPRKDDGYEKFLTAVMSTEVYLQALREVERQNQIQLEQLRHSDEEALMSLLL